MHLESWRISTAATNLPEPLLDGLTYASVNTGQTSIRCGAAVVVVLVAVLMNHMQIRNFQGFLQLIQMLKGQPRVRVWLADKMY